MFQALTPILLCQVAGEAEVRAARRPLPCPVRGMGMMLALLALSDRRAESVVPVGQGVLRHRSLLYVPAGTFVAIGMGLNAVLTALIAPAVLRHFL